MIVIDVGSINVATLLQGSNPVKLSVRRHTLQHREQSHDPLNWGIYRSTPMLLGQIRSCCISVMRAAPKELLPLVHTLFWPCTKRRGPLGLKHPPTLPVHRHLAGRGRSGLFTPPRAE